MSITLSLKSVTDCYTVADQNIVPADGAQATVFLRVQDGSVVHPRPPAPTPHALVAPGAVCVEEVEQAALMQQLVVADDAHQRRRVPALQYERSPHQKQARAQTQGGRYLLSSG